jgi:hypothetical protein
MPRDMHATLVGSAIVWSAAEALQAWFRFGNVGWWLLFAFELPVWFYWIATLPVLFAIARRFPLVGDRWRARIATHVALQRNAARG